MKEKNNKRIKLILELIILFLCLIIFIFILKGIFKKEILSFDINGYNWISKYIISDKLTPFVKVITHLGSAYILIPITLLSFLILKNKRNSICITINLIIIALSNALVKNIVARPRPEGFPIIEESGFSFPSGHAMVSAAFYGFLAYLIYKNIQNKILKYSLIIFLAILTFLIGLSRIYLGVHYISDVFAGFLLSVIYLILFINITRGYRKEGEVNEK